MKRLMCLIMAFCLLFSLSACAASEPEAPAQKPGRWIEEEIDIPIPENAGRWEFFSHDDDDTLDVVFYNDADVVIGWVRTQDGCETWQTMDISFLDEPMRAFSNPACQLCIGQNNQVWFSLSEQTSSDETILFRAVSDWYKTSSEEEASSQEEIFYYYLQDGEAVSVPISSNDLGDDPNRNSMNHPFYPLANGDCLFDNCWVKSEGREIWRIDPSGRQVDSYTVQEEGLAYPYLATMFTAGSVSGGRIVADGIGATFIVDLNDGYTQEISAQSLPPRPNITGLSEDGSLYAISSQSIQQLKPGSTLVEELLSGQDYFFGGNTNHFSAVFPMGNYIYTVINEGRLFRYHYDENAVLENQGSLTVFSMHDDTAVRQTIAELRLTHPGLTVQYRIGDEEMEGGLTKDDLIKSLNTELLAGTGPDVLILDDMAPLDSYLESGVFTDLTDLIDTSGLYENLLGCGQYQGRQYAIPAGFGFPALLSYYDDMENRLDGVAPSETPPRLSSEPLPSYTTLTSLLTDSREQFEKDISQKMGDAGRTRQIYLLSNYWGYSRDALYFAALPDLTAPDGGRKYIKEFLEAISWMHPASDDQILSHNPYSMLAAEYLRGFPFGSYQKAEPLPSLTGKKAYCPYSIAAIPVKKTSSENAVIFLNTMLSEPVQSQLLSISVYGYHTADSAVSYIPLRESALKNHHFSNVPSFVSSALLPAVKQLDTPVILNASRAEAFNKIVIDYLQGVLSLDEAADAILEDSSREDTLSALEREK
ncbi:MAG: hypothetical protein Q4G07_01000 [Oscillospiraceae bacterium]|nr:hypothetical protein [Oscillospiraceae bacterium]